ncbi:MAG: insulinase family protein [Pyrinomonas sp.]|uniref:M16 family metallopeptidase n=1 Tax=Pyrinomonas sp. TaxID=2080306 RepID=UPI00332058E9
MKSLLACSLLLCLPLAVLAQQKRKILPYDYAVDDLPNGLRLITAPTEHPNLVALYIVVAAGSRNEVEPGKSGYAHLFEHMMFRGSKNFTPEERDALLKRAGASSNAYTTDDRTVYHEVFSKDDLERIMELEADRFLRLQYSPEVYQTETGAVLGEYNKNSSSPFFKLYETLRATAFRRHTYSHTTMGFLEDIKDMPNQYDYSLQFYNRYYRPEYTTIILVGDVTRDRALALTRKYFGDWQRGNYRPEIPSEPPQDGPRTAHVDWPAQTLPLVAIAFRGPAYSDERKDKAALDLLAPIAFGENSDLYRKLVLKEQKADLIEVEFDNKIDPELFTVYARVKNPQDVEYVRDEVLKTFERFTREPVDPKRLDATRSHLRYGFALAMDSSEAVASALAPFVALRRTPETVERLYALYDQITPEDIREMAARYFTEKNRTIVTLAARPNGAKKEGGR